MKTYKQYLEAHGRDFEGKYSKPLERLAKKDARVDYYEHDQDGHWFILKRGWMEDGYNTTVLRHDTVKGIRDKLDTVVKIA